MQLLRYNTKPLKSPAEHWRSARGSFEGALVTRGSKGTESLLDYDNAVLYTKIFLRCLTHDCICMVYRYLGYEETLWIKTMRKCTDKISHVSRHVNFFPAVSSQSPQPLNEHNT